MAIFGNGTFKEGINVKRDHLSGPYSSMTGVFIGRGDKNTYTHTEDHVKAKGEGHLQAKRRNLRRKLTLLIF